MPSNMVLNEIRYLTLCMLKKQIYMCDMKVYERLT